METSFIIFFLLLVVVAIFVFKGIVIIKQSETMVVERFGKYLATLPSGVNMLWPFFDQPRLIEWRFIETDIGGNTIVRKQSVTRIDLRETVYDFPRQSVITRDNVAIEINALLYFQVTDPKRAIYEIANLPDADREAYTDYIEKCHW